MTAVMIQLSRVSGSFVLDDLRLAPLVDAWHTKLSCAFYRIGTGCITVGERW